MNAYIYQSDFYCEDCTKQIIDDWDNSLVCPEYLREDSDHYPQGPYSDGGGEADSPQHCYSCRVFLENPLTDYGDIYVRDEAKAFETEFNMSWTDIADKARSSGQPALADWILYYLAEGS